MGNLEHNIKEAFAAQDAKTKLADKDGMWSRLDSAMGRRKGVAALWRVAAILLGVFLLTGAFATLNFRTIKQAEIEKLELDNTSLQTTIDSLLAVPVPIQTKIQVVEKEKIVYCEKQATQQNSDLEQLWEQEYSQLADSANFILASKEKIHKQELTQLNKELEALKQELALSKEGEKSETEGKHSAPFELKSDRVEVEVSKKPSVKNPEIEMKVFQKNFIENRNNLNSTIFKK